MDNREQELRDALLPLAQHGVTHEQAWALVIASSAALRPGMSMGWYAVKTICKDVFDQLPVTTQE